MPLHANQREIMQRLHTAVTSGENIIVDLRAHNGAKERYDRFWEIVREIIEERTAVDCGS